MTFNSIPWLLLRHVPEEEIASATAFNLVLRFLGMSAGSALATLLSVGTQPGGRAGERGHLVGGLAGLTISLLAAALCLVLARPTGLSVNGTQATSEPAA